MTFFGLGIIIIAGGIEYIFVNLRLIVTILVIAAASVCAQAQKPNPAKVTKADAQKVLRIISSDKAKTRIYCEMAKLGK